MHRSIRMLRAVQHRLFELASSRTGAWTLSGTSSISKPAGKSLRSQSAARAAIYCSGRPLRWLCSTACTACGRRTLIMLSEPCRQFARADNSLRRHSVSAMLTCLLVPEECHTGPDPDVLRQMWTM